MTSSLLSPDLPPVYTYPSITPGFKAGASPPEARLAEHATVEAEPAEPQCKTLPPPRLAREEEETGEEEDGRLVEAQIGAAEEGKVEKCAEGKGRSERRGQISGLPSCPPPAPAPDPAGRALKVELSLGCPGQKVNLVEPQLPKEQVAVEEHGEEDVEADVGETIGPEPTECAVSVCEEEEEEEDGDNNEGNVEVVEDEEDEKASGMRPGEDLVGLSCRSPAPSSSPDPVQPPAAVQLQGAYTWSLELLIAAALCATRDALNPPAPAVRAPSPPPHHGMEILGELAELEIQQRSRGKGEGEFLPPSVAFGLFQNP